MNKRSIVALWIAIAVALGCGPQNIFGDVIDDATGQIGERIAERVVNAYLGDIGPAIIESYSIGLMQTMFYQAGYHGDHLEYEPGEYTIWVSEDSPYGETMERAFLHRRDDGWEWWRLEVFGEDPDTDDEVHLIMEALFEPDDDRRYIREMYVQYPDDEEPTELAVREDEQERWALRAEEWSDQEREQAFVDTVEIEVPAGRFVADHYTADAPEEDDVRTDWWETEREVPGSVVKVRQAEQGDGEVFQTVALESYGTGADESVLGAF